MPRPRAVPVRARPGLAGAAGAVLLLLLCSCGGTITPSATASATPAVKRFTASAFTTAMPPEWTDHTTDQQAVSSINAGGAVQMLLIAPPAHASVGNEHIDVTTTSQPVPDDQLAMYLQSVGQNGATNLTQPEPFDLDGATGIFITYGLTSSNGVALMAQDMLVNHGGVTYDIVLNTAKADFNTQLPALQQVLTSWHWTS